jgi:hypothetical protein
MMVAVIYPKKNGVLERLDRISKKMDEVLEKKDNPFSHVPFSIISNAGCGGCVNHVSNGGKFRCHCTLSPLGV